MDYECVLDIENQSVVVDASVEPDAREQSVFIITCNPHQVRKYILYKYIYIYIKLVQNILR